VCEHAGKTKITLATRKCILYACHTYRNNVFYTAQTVYSPNPNVFDVFAMFYLLSFYL